MPKIAQMMQGGEKIDIIEIRDHTLRTYVTNNWLVNMQPYIDNWDEKRYPQRRCRSRHAYL